MRSFPNGTVTFSMTGGYAENFLNELFARKMNVSGVKNSDGILYADIGRNTYPAAARLARQYGVRTRAVKRRGVSFRLAALWKRPGLVLGSFAAVALVLVLKLFVWHIEIHGNEELTDVQILGMLEQNGFTAGVYANDTNALSAERRMMMSTDKIKWINIEVNGSRADVYLTENNSGKSADIDTKTPCNIVAARTGVIVDADVVSGKMQYEKGSGVAEGSVIVSGTVSSGDAVILVHSEAKVIADFTEDVEFSMNYTTTEKVPSGKTYTDRQLMLFGMVFPLGGDIADTGNMVCTESTEVCRLWGIELPVKIKTASYTQYKDITVTRKAEDVQRILESRLEMYEYNFLKGYEILGTEKDLSFDENGGVLKAHIKLRGDIGVKQPIYQH